MRLRAVDAAAERTTIASWDFNVEKAPEFSLNNNSAWSLKTDGKLEGKYHVSETHLLPKPRLPADELLQHPAGGDFKQVRGPYRPSFWTMGGHVDFVYLAAC